VYVFSPDENVHYNLTYKLYGVKVKLGWLNESSIQVISSHMTTSSFFGESSHLAFEFPKYLPLEGKTSEHACRLLMRKGGLLKPALSQADAQKLVAFMSLEHFSPGSLITFNAQDEDVARLMLIIVGEANIRMRPQAGEASISADSPMGRVQKKWFNVGEGSSLGLVHLFSGLSSRFVAQAVSELFVASLSRIAFQQMKKQEPLLAMQFLEITALELALVALDHEKNLVALSSVARSMQSHINDETGDTSAAPLE
jgi:CRP-like cAMP-binding protein